MPLLPAARNLTGTQGATFLFVMRRVYNKQTITLSGAGTGDWYISLYRTQTTALPRSASVAAVQAALQALPRVGTTGVSVSGTAGVSYTLTWAGPLLSVEVERVQITTPANVLASVDNVPFDWTDWEGVFRVRLLDVDKDPTGTKVLEIDESTDPDVLGQVIFGYEYPSTPGGADGTPDVTNGRVAIKIPASKTLTLFDDLAVGQYGAAYVLLVTQTDTGGQTQALLDGAFAIKEEPET